MPVTGGKDLVAALRRLPERTKAEVTEAIRQSSEAMLDEMRRRTPVDPASKTHARDGLTLLTENDGQTVHVGLPTEDLTQKYFWFRFLDLGTRGYQPGDIRRTTGSKTTKHINRLVPPRPALRIREQALDSTRDEIERRIGNAVRRAIED